MHEAAEEIKNMSSRIPGLLVLAVVIFVGYQANKVLKVDGTPAEQETAKNQMADNLVSLSTPTPPPAPACAPGAFAVKDIKFRREYDNLIMTGTVTNQGTKACGVQLKASTYDKSSRVVDTTDFWPASVRNIAPGANENFKYFVRFDRSATNYDVIAINARAW